MNTAHDVPEARRPTTVAITSCTDATTFGRTVDMTAGETARLRTLLAALCEYGLLLPASVEPEVPGYGFGDVVAQLRASIGANIVDAALAARERHAPGGDPPPTAVMPVWEFEPEGDGEDVLLSSARMWGADLFVVALRVAGDDDPAPVPSVRDRFARWAEAAGAGRALLRVRLPGRGGSSVVFAASAPA